ncbi:MAG: YIP1 family protein [Dehalococcoidia bacterium]|nr:YIP1 family protein [Dehalococcoidia bacterium]
MMSQAGGMNVQALVERLRRLAMLDTSVFDEVRVDTTATIPAIVVAAVSILLFGFGGWFWWVLADIGGTGKVFWQSLILGSIVAFLLWGIWIGITYVILTQVFHARADLNELARVMAFATVPLALGVLMFIPGLDYGIGLTAVALLLGLTVIAVQTVTDAPAGRVLAATGAGFVVWAVVLGLLVSNSHIYAPGVFVFDTGTEFLKSLSSSFSSF